MTLLNLNYDNLISRKRGRTNENHQESEVGRVECNRKGLLTSSKFV